MSLSKEQAKAIVMKKMNMSEEEFTQKEQWVKNGCICAGCSSYTADETELGFCWSTVGKSQVISEEKGCVCGNCPVYEELALTRNYYCTRDSEISQKMSGVSGM